MNQCERESGLDSAVAFGQRVDFIFAFPELFKDIGGSRQLEMR